MIVSNAGPPIALGKLGQLGLLLKLYKELVSKRQNQAELCIDVL
jgi:predicted nucleic acid-binding protein